MSKGNMIYARLDDDELATLDRIVEVLQYLYVGDSVNSRSAAIRYIIQQFSDTLLNRWEMEVTRKETV